MLKDAKIKKWLACTARKMWHGKKKKAKDVTIHLLLKSQDRSELQNSIQSHKMYSQDTKAVSPRFS